jgi:hypothetical protein
MTDENGMTLLKSPRCAWLMLTASLPGRSGTPRVRLWRGVRDLGAVALRDGVYLLPDTPSAREGFRRLAIEVVEAHGEALILELAPQPLDAQRDLVARFDRGEHYAEVLTTAAAVRERLPRETESAARRALRSLHRELAAVESIDFFPGEAREEARGAVAALAITTDARFSPGGPMAESRLIPRLDVAAYQGRTWATRRRPWVDRLASAWLIRRFVDPQARFLWLADPADCPADAVGFDFDGAAFSHVGKRVTFEVLLVTFGLDGNPALGRVGSLVRHLENGGTPVAEAPGFEAVLAGLRAGLPDDDALLAAALPLLDALYRNYSGTHS